MIAEGPVYRLRRYYADDANGDPVVLVPPMMLAADVYDVGADEPGISLAVAAVTLLDGRELDDRTLADALSVLPRAERPDVVRVVDEIPVTTWYRPSTGSLRDQGIPSGKRVWRRQGERYVSDG